MDSAFLSRYINDNFSGGEKKRMEIVQMAVLRPEMAVLDETDSGLDVDALRTVAEGVNRVRGDGMGILIITHYQRILDYITPDKVHVMAAGKVIASGGAELVTEIEKNGYDPMLREAGVETGDSDAAGAAA
jgi:Fe-S cluster assembly ATP-binding protein